MKLRHDVSGIAHVTTADDAATCSTMVLRGAMYEPCGLARGADGRCPEGH